MWFTTKDGKHVNTDWFDKDRQIEANKKEAEKLNRESKRPKRLSSNDDPEKLREELKSKLIDKDSYLHSDEYRELDKKVQDTWKKKNELEERRKELWEIEKKGSTIDEKILKEFDGNRQLASLFAKKDDSAKAAEFELKELKTKIEEVSKQHEKAANELKNYENDFSSKQKDKFFEEKVKGNKSTLSTKIKSDYRGFELNTGTSNYQDLLKKGQAVIVEMSPQEYLERCAVDIFGSTYERQVRAILADAKHTYKLADKMSNGTKMYMPWLDYEEKGQEGRHRAAAAVLEGIERIPVLVVPRKRR